MVSFQKCPGELYIEIVTTESRWSCRKSTGVEQASICPDCKRYKETHPHHARQQLSSTRCRILLQIACATSLSRAGHLGMLVNCFELRIIIVLRIFSFFVMLTKLCWPIGILMFKVVISVARQHLAANPRQQTALIAIRRIAFRKELSTHCMEMRRTELCGFTAMIVMELVSECTFLNAENYLNLSFNSKFQTAPLL